MAVFTEFKIDGQCRSRRWEDAHFCDVQEIMEMEVLRQKKGKPT